MVDFCEDRRKTTQPQITQNHYNESADELNRMDIFVCGTCYFVAHFVEQFLEHKSEPCERTDIIQPNTSDQKPQVWSFLLWKNAKTKSNSANSSWQLYQEWCALPEAVKDTWIQAGQFLKGVAAVKNYSRKTFSDSFHEEDELSTIKATMPHHPVANSNKVLKKTRGGKFLDVIVEKILAKRIVNKKTEFWVKYKGRPLMEEKFWEPIEALNATCQDLITTFESKTYLAPDLSRKRTISQTNDLASVGLIGLGNRTSNKQRMDHVQQWVQDDTSGRIHGEDDDVAKKKMRTDENGDDYEEFFLRRSGGIILRSEMKSCTKPKDSIPKKKNLAAEIGLESEEEEEEGGKENIFGRKNVPAVLKPNDNKVLVVNSQGVVALDPVEIPNLSSGIYIMTNKNEESKPSEEVGTSTPSKPTNTKEKKPAGECGGFVILDDQERCVKYTNNEALGRVSRPLQESGASTPLANKLPALTSFKSGALTITPSVRNISKDPAANFARRQTIPHNQSHTQSPSLQKILGPKNTKSYTAEFSSSTPKVRQQQPQVIYTSQRQQPQITYLNSSGETTNKRVLGSVNRYKATPDKQAINHSEIHYTQSPVTNKTIIKQEPPNLLIPTSGYQIDNTGVTDTVMIKVEMSPGGTNQYVRGLSGLDSPQYAASVNAALQGQVSGLKVKRITSPRKRNSSVRDSAHISILNRKDTPGGGGGNALAVPARKLKMFRNEEEEVNEEQGVVQVPTQPQVTQEMVTIAGEDGTLYQVASSELNGSAVLLTTGEDGNQQCLYVMDENGQPTIIQGATIDGQEMLLDQAVYNEATGTIQMFQDQSGMETQVFQQDENGQLLPVDNPDEVLAQVQAAQEQEQLLQQQQEQAEAEQLAALQQEQQMVEGQEHQELTEEQAAEFLQQQQQEAAAALAEAQQQHDQQQQEEQEGGIVLSQQEQEGGVVLSQEEQEALQQQGLEGLAVEGGEQEGDSSEVVAQLVEASEPSADGGPRKVVLLLSDGNLIQTEMSEEQFAALENS
uniref:Chromo domain-containing protein n=1 Tax=Cacopsylla melanoneura TaxID=428564 RepID=A0A8D8YHC6_9HEMI